VFASGDRQFGYAVGWIVAGNGAGRARSRGQREVFHGLAQRVDARLGDLRKVVTTRVEALHARSLRQPSRPKPRI